MKKKRTKRRTARTDPWRTPGKVIFVLPDGPNDDAALDVPSATGWNPPAQVPTQPLDTAELTHFNGLIQAMGAPTMLSAISFYRFTRRGGEDEQRLPQSERMEQIHAELLQSMLACKPDSWRTGTATLKEIYEGKQLAVRMINAELATTSASRLGDLSLLMAGQTRFTRHWTDPRQHLSLLTTLVAPLDDQYERAMGLKLTGLIRVLQALPTALESRSKHYVDWHNELRSVDPREWRATAQRFWPQIEFTESRYQEAASPSNLECMLHAPLAEVFTWTTDQLASLGPCESRYLSRVLNAWTITPGEAATVPLADLFLNNPVWLRPFVGLPDGRYFLPFPGIPFGFLLELLEQAIALDPPTHRRYVQRQRRAHFLEAEIEQIVRRAFPRAEVFPNNEFPGGQNDLTVKVDDLVLVIEAKAGRVAPAARRGGRLSLERALREVVMAGSQQAYKFIQFMEESKRTGSQAILSDGRVIDLRGVVEFLPCVVHLEPLGMVGADSKRIAKTLGAAASEPAPAMAISLSDFQTVMEFMESPAQRLHYLYRRRQFEVHHNYIADEMDLLAMYFDNQLIFEDRLQTGDMFLYGKSVRVSEWLARDDILHAVAKPRRRMTPRFVAALDRLSLRQRPGWMRSALVLQDVWDENQRAVEQRLRQVARTFRRRRRNSPLSTSVLRQTLFDRGLDICLIVHGAVAMDLIRSTVDASHDLRQGREFLILAVDIESDPEEDPYTILAAGVDVWDNANDADVGNVLT